MRAIKFFVSIESTGVDSLEVRIYFWRLLLLLGGIYAAVDIMRHILGH